MKKTVFTICISIILFGCSNRKTTDTSSRRNWVNFVYTQDSVNSYFNSFGLSDLEIHYIDSSLIGTSTSSIPFVLVLNEEGKVIHNKPCNADFPDFIKTNKKGILKNRPIQQNNSTTKIEKYFRKNKIQLNTFNVVYFVSIKAEKVFPTVESYLVPLLKEAESHPDFSVVTVFSNNHEFLGLDSAQYHLTNFRNSFQTQQDFGEVPENWKEFYKEDTVMFEGLY